MLIFLVGVLEFLLLKHRQQHNNNNKHRYGETQSRYRCTLFYRALHSFRVVHIGHSSSLYRGGVVVRKRSTQRISFRSYVVVFESALRIYRITQTPNTGTGFKELYSMNSPIKRIWYVMFFDHFFFMENHSRKSTTGTVSRHVSCPRSHRFVSAKQQC